MRVLLVLHICLCVICAWYVKAESCCDKVSSSCDFLCDDTNDGSWWENIRCGVERAKLEVCKVKNIDVVDLFGEDFSGIVQKGWNTMSDALKKTISTVSGFKNVAVSELKKVHQDVLSGLHTLRGMTKEQFKGIAYRFKDFTSENLRHLMNRIDLSVIFENIEDLASTVWDRSQLNVLAKTVYKKYGSNVTSWTSNQLKSLGNIMAGLPDSDFAKFSVKVFDESLETLCDVRLSSQKKINLLVPARSLFGKISQWNSSTITRMCHFVEELAPEQILSMTSNEIAAALPELKKRIFNKSQRQAVFKKLKDAWGEVSTWSNAKLQKLGKFAQDLDLEDIKKLDMEQLKMIIKQEGSNIWNDAQGNEIVKKFLKDFGDPKDWPGDLLEDSLGLLQKLSTNDFKNISKSTLANVLKYGTKVKWTKEQATYLLSVVEGETPLSTFTKDSIIGIDSILNGFLASDVGKFSKVVFFAAFPEMIPAVGLGEPVVRYLIQVYKDESKNGEIKSFGQFAKYLTREDLSQQQIQDLLGNLEQLANLDFDEAQTAELMIKLRSKLGNMNLTDKSDDDVLKWGVQNLEKMGKVVLAFTREEMKNFPFRGIDSSIEVLGKQDGWKRRMVIAGYKRMKEFWKHYNVTVKNMTEAHMEILGKYVQGLTLKELNALPTDVQKIAIQKLGEFTGLPKDKLKSRAYFALEYLKKVSGGDLKSSDIKLLGNLFAGLSKHYISKIDLKVLWNNLEDILKTKDIPTDNLKEIVTMVKKSLNENDLGKWTVDQITKLGQALKTLEPGDIRAISKDVFDDVVDQLGSIDSWNTGQLQALVEKAKEAWGSDVSKWSEKALRRMGSIINGLSTSDIDDIPKSVFQKIDQFGKGHEIKKELKESLAKQVKKYLLDNDPSNFDMDIIKRFNNILSGFSAHDISYIKVDTLDMLDELSRRDDWSKEQMEHLARKAKHIVSAHANTDGITSVKNLIKGYSGIDIRSISNEGFRLAAAKLGSVKDLSKEQKKELANKAKEAWGVNPSTWTAGHISEAGAIIEGLTESDLSDINPQHIDRIPSAVVQNLDKGQIQALTAKQLSELSEEQANVLSDDQKSGLTEPKRQALQSVLDDDPKEDDPFPPTSSASWLHATIPMITITMVINFLVFFF